MMSIQHVQQQLQVYRLRHRSPIHPPSLSSTLLRSRDDWSGASSSRISVRPSVPAGQGTLNTNPAYEYAYRRRSLVRRSLVRRSPVLALADISARNDALERENAALRCQVHVLTARSKRMLLLVGGGCGGVRRGPSRWTNAGK